MSDDYDLQRFLAAQEPVYDDALEILRHGMMCSPYVDFVFPRLAYATDTANLFAISTLDEARAYLAFPILGNRYRECIGALAWLADETVHDVFDDVDARKLHASLTLFSEASSEPVLRTMLDLWFANLADEATMLRIEQTI